MNRRGYDFLRAIGALVLIVVLAVGVPALLISLVGNPFPTSIPSVGEIEILLTQNGQGFTNFLIGALAVFIWVMWAQLMVALLVETLATVRNTETRRLRTAPGIQALAARLIAAITLATTLAAGPLLAPAVGALSFGNIVDDALTSTPVVAVASFDNSPTNAASVLNTAPPPVRSTVASDQGSLSVVVAERSELWDIAEAAYGDGVSWKVIAAANAGLHDANGVMITNETEVVAPGTELVLPGAADRAAVAVFGDNGVRGSNAIHVVEAGDSMWSLAQEHVENGLDRPATDVEIGGYWSDVVDANQDVPSGDVDLIYPGDELVMPGTAPGELTDAQPLRIEHRERPVDENEPEHQIEGFVQPAETATHTSEVRQSSLGTTDSSIETGSMFAVTPTGAPSIQAGGSHAEVSAPLLRDDERQLSVPAAGLAAFGSAVLAAGVVMAIRRRRDLQRRTRPAGATAQPPSTEAAAFEAALAYAADQVIESQHGAGWRMLPAQAVAAMRAAGPLQIHAGSSGFFQAVTEINTSTATETRRIDLQNPSVEEDLAELASQSVDADVPLVDPVVADPGTAIVPTTLVVGTESGSGEAVLLDLASVKQVALQGSETDIRRFARGAVLDLAVSDRADDLCVIALGIATDLSDLERVRCVNSYPDALLQAVRCGHASPDSTTPVVVVAAFEPSENDSSLAGLLGLGALVVAPGLTSGSRLRLDGDIATIEPAGTVVAVATFDDVGYRAVTELVQSTSSQALEAVGESRAVHDVLDVIDLSDCVVEAGPIEVKVLGPVEISGADSFSSLKAIDVIAYLAFHRNGMDADQIKSWVWPAFKPPTDKAFANVMSRARTALGTCDDGSPYLSRAGADKTYRLHQVVTTDFDRFRAVVELADESAETNRTIALLKQALELIRGIPFTGGAASSFAWADNHVRAQVEYTIDETVHRCADLALEIGDLATARWAALKGLELVPGCEQCFRRRFLVASAGKNRTELRRAMADLEASAALELGEPEAVDTISGDLLDLYHELDQALVAGAR